MVQLESHEAARVETAEGHDEVHSEEELRLLVSESYKNGEINQSEYKYVNKILNLMIGLQKK